MEKAGQQQGLSGLKTHTRLATREKRRTQKRNQAVAAAVKALIRFANREIFLEMVLAWITPLPDARCISG